MTREDKIKLDTEIIEKIEGQLERTDISDQSRESLNLRLKRLRKNLSEQLNLQELGLKSPQS